MFMHKRKSKERSQEYKQITESDRYQIEALLTSWVKKYAIAKQLWFGHTSIGREIERNWYFNLWWKLVYRAKVAQENYENRRWKAVLKQNILMNDCDMQSKVIQWLEAWLSPDTISGRARLEWYKTRKNDKMASTKAIYNYIHEHNTLLERLLLYKQWWYKKHKGIDKKPKICPDLPRIADRSVEINDRKNIWDCEFDSIISGDHKWWATTWVERKTRYTWIKKAKNVDWKTTMYNILNMTSWYNITSITTDNWSEFCYLDVLWVRLWIACYLCDPYSSWQRWSNENSNRIIRRYIPKWINIDLYTDEEIQNIQDTINKKPRKILWYQTPYELMHGTKLRLF